MNIHIKVTRASTAPIQGSPVGAVLVGSDLWLTTYPGAYPFCVSNATALIEDAALSSESPNGSSGGLSESTLLKIIAITIDPKRQRDLIK